MNRSAKGFRVISGIFVLLNIVAFFLPMTQCVKENYPTKTWSQLDYIINVMGENEPYGTAFTVSRLVWAGCFIIIPLLLVLIAGIWGIVGSDKQIGSSILSFVVLVLYIGLVVTIKFYFPEDTFSFREAGTVNLICSGCGVLAAIIALILTPKTEEDPVMTDIPQIMEMKQQQVEARYNIITNDFQENQEQPGKNQQVEQKSSQPEIPAYVPGAPRGVLVGLTGMYAGAEIPFENGECIKLGRLPSNDLVFEGQEKVSRNHCRIKWDADSKKFVFCDYSSNGTYVNGSEECLPQNLELPMEPGTIIAIGDEENTFRLE